MKSYITLDLATEYTRIFTIHNYIATYYKDRELEDLEVEHDFFIDKIDKKTELITFYYHADISLEARYIGDHWKIITCDNQNAYQILKSNPKFWSNILMELNKTTLKLKEGNNDN